MFKYDTIWQYDTNGKIMALKKLVIKSISTLLLKRPAPTSHFTPFLWFIGFPSCKEGKYNSLLSLKKGEGMRGLNYESQEQDYLSFKVTWQSNFMEKIRKFLQAFLEKKYEKTDKQTEGISNYLPLVGPTRFSCIFSSIFCIFSSHNFPWKLQIIFYTQEKPQYLNIYPNDMNLNTEEDKLSQKAQLSRFHISKVLQLQSKKNYKSRKPIRGQCYGWTNLTT